MIYAFSQLAQVLTVDQCRSVYFAYVQSIIMYGILVWGGASLNVLEPLAVTQRAIIRTILKLGPRYPSGLILPEFRVLNVRQLYIKSLVIFISFNKKELFVDTDHSYETRARKQGGVSMPKLNYSFEAVNAKYLIYVIWRNLPPEIKLLVDHDSVAVRKHKITDWLCRIGPETAESLICLPYTNVTIVHW